MYKEYIEKAQIIRHLMGESISKYPSTFVTGLCAATDEIIHFPAADVVEVVRCKDCKHWKAMDNGIDWHNKGRTDGTCKMLHEMHYAECCLTAENHFCSYGERKEE